MNNPNKRELIHFIENRIKYYTEEKNNDKVEALNELLLYIKDEDDVKYISDRFNVKCNDIVIARSYVGNCKIEVRILQGMPRMETWRKICKDCPDFVKECGLNENYHPLLFSD